jgi:hypothetical protein
MKYLFTVLFLLALTSVSLAQPTWSTHIAPIFYEHCTVCHHNSGIAPFSLMTWEDAYNESEDIVYAIEEGHMPPWPPDTTYQRFSHERVLNAEEVALILEWVDLGMPIGNTDLAPPPPVYNEDGFITLPPDLELTMPLYTSNATFQSDDYSCFALPSGLLQNKKIRAFEVIPGNPEIVHHALVFIDANATYATNTSGFCMGPQDGLIGGYTPGAFPTVFPSDGVNFNLGVSIPAGSNVILAMHYPNGSQGMTDQTKIRLWFYPDATTIREVLTNSILQDWTLSLPPNQITTVYTDFDFIPVDASVLSVFPHMHLLGESIESYAVKPNNDTIPFIRINKWDFHWQQFFYFRNILRVPAGSTMFGRATYNNTVDNPHNPNNPPLLVTAGLNTSNEMFLIYFQFLPYLPGDELQDLEALTQMPGITGINEVNTTSAVKVFPNPAVNQFHFDFNLESSSVVSLYLYDVKGRLMDQVLHQVQMPAGNQQIPYTIKSHLKPGIYTYSVNIGSVMSSGKLLVIAE